MMNNFSKFRKTLASFLAPQKNSMGREFLRFGNRGNVMNPDWSEVIMNDIDHYKGYGYAAIKNRANKTARIAIENIRTESVKDNFEHPYLELITNSTDFSDTQFWHDISTYLDLEGVYYLMAVRAVAPGRVGKIQEFKMLNPYNIRRVMSADTLTVGGYVESRKGRIREIPKEMIIEIRELNPFDEDNPYAMTDAAKGPQFTLQTSGDYTRHALRNNINAPGILSTDVELEEEDFKNFTERVKNHIKGEPIFGNGKGAIDWKDMQIHLKDSALTDVTEVNRAELLSTLGVSKTILGIEESGTTRDTARVQKELHIEDHIIPRIQLILDALNLDYQKFYKEYQSNKAIMVVDNPMAVDIEADTKEVDLKDKQLDLYQKLINKGVDKKVAADYVMGDIGIELLDIEKIELSELPALPTPKEEKDEKQSIVKNDFSSNLIVMQQGSLQNAIVNIDMQLASTAINRISRFVKNEIKEEYDEFSEYDLVPYKDQKESEAELIGLLVGFYGMIMALQGTDVTKDRTQQYNLSGNFTLDSAVKQYIDETAKLVSGSHIKTISNDLYQAARKAALEGKSLSEIQSMLRREFSSSISINRAKTIARTETNRIFTRAQFEADRQFIAQNNIIAYKQWKTRSDNPCPLCLELEAEGKIPFANNFRSIGEAVVSDGKTYDVDFEDLEAGNLHPNCQCTYELFIEIN